MIAKHLLKGLNKSGDDDFGRAGCALLLLGIVITVAIVIRIAFWMLPDKTAPLLAEADGLLRFSSIEEARAYTQLPLFLPEDRLGSEVKVVGVYTKTTQFLPEASTVTVLAKNNWRFADITIQPMSAWDILENRYSAIGTPIVIGEKEGYLVQLPATSHRCLPPTQEGIGACELQTLILFSSNNLVFTIAGDGTHITDGELILLARDLVSKLPAEEKTPPMP